MNGIVIVNKPKGCTSHDVVHRVKKIVNEKVGHTGTLDPMVEGVLPLLIGKGTLCSKYLINHDKTYQVVLQLGEKKDTADSEGNTIETDTNIDKVIEDCKEKIKEIFKSFVGKQEQIPPIYSAIKVDGKKLYEYARKGQAVEIKSREIEIYEMIFNKVDLNKKQIQFTVSCSKGTYIRTLCEDISKKLGTIGYMKELKRIVVGDFDISESVSIEELEQNENNKEWLERNIITIEKLFEKKDKIDLKENKLHHFLNGVRITQNVSDGVYRIYCNKQFIGTGEVKNNLLKRDIIV